MKRGRPRRYNPNIPAHIDQKQIPEGCYWSNGDRCWYMRKPRYRRLAGPQASLAALHRLVEEITHDPAAPPHGSIAWLHGHFQRSDAYKRLARATQRDYDACLRALERLNTRVGAADTLHVDKLDKVLVQRLVDTIGKDRPSSANHVRRWLQRLFKWGMARGRMRDRPNPAKGLEVPRERAQHKMPSRPTLAATLRLARSRAQRTARTAGALPHYLWPFMFITYTCRLRSIETLDLTEADALPMGIRVHRRKGSKDNIVAWSPALRRAWNHAIAQRDAAWRKRNAPIPLKPEDRPLLVNASGHRLESWALRSAWRRLRDLSLEAGIVTADTWYTMHGLKHRGITDSGDKTSGGHVDPRMIARYDHDVPVVAPAGRGSRTPS